MLGHQHGYRYNSFSFRHLNPIICPQFAGGKDWAVAVSPIDVLDLARAPHGNEHVFLLRSVPPEKLGATYHPRDARLPARPRVLACPAQTDVFRPEEGERHRAPEMAAGNLVKRIKLTD